MRALIEKNLQTLLNHYIQLDPESKTRLEKLENKIVMIELLNINLIFQLIFTKDEILIQSFPLLEPHTTIKGTPLSLLHMSLRPKSRKQFFSDDVSIVGEIELGQKVIELFDSLEIDWEEHLSHWMGDIPAHQVGKIVGKFKRFSTNVREVLLQNINEYTHEEIPLFPAVEEIENFFGEVDALRMSIDRLDSKIARLTNTVNENLKG